MNCQHLRCKQKIRLEDETTGPAMGSDGNRMGKPGTKKPASLDQFLVWTTLDLWQDLSRVIIPSSMSLALTSNSLISMYNMIEITEVTYIEIMYHNFLPLLIPSRCELREAELYTYTN